MKISSEQVKVVIPESPEERLSSRQRSAGVKPRRGWTRIMAGINRNERGGYAFLGRDGEPFARAGEYMLAVGTIVMVAHYEDTAKFLIVTHDGDLANVRGADGEIVWHKYKTATLSTCDAYESLDAMAYGDFLAWSRDTIAAKAAADKSSTDWSEAVAKANARLATWKARATVDVEGLRAERARLLARVAEIDAVLDSVAPSVDGES